MVVKLARKRPKLPMRARARLGHWLPRHPSTALIFILN